VTDYIINFLQNQKDPPGKPSILVVTPLLELGEIIHESLKEVADVEHSSTASKAISFLRETPGCKQVILDMEMGGLNLLDLGRSLRQINSSIKLIIISKAELPTDLDEIQPWQFLRKPILLRDLQAVLGVETGTSSTSTNIIDLDSLKYENRTPLHWSNNAALATHYLARLIDKSFAQEALLIQNQALWSYAGRLPEESVREVGRMVSKSSAGSNITDFMRFVKLETTQSEHALYASLIAIGVILALVFDPDIPLAVIRRQTHKLAETLVLLEGEDGNIKALSKGEKETNPISERNSSSSNRYHYSLPELENDETGIGLGRFSENNTLKSPLSNHHLHGITDNLPFQDPFTDLKIPKSTEESDQFVHKEKMTEVETPVSFSRSGNEQTISLVGVLSDSQYNLPYTCLLIPRFPSHRLTRDKMAMISESVRNTNISYGWRLDEVEVKPEFLRWTTSLPPSLAPTKYLDTIRKETSKRIFEDFPPYKDENPSGDFWAPGFLILGGEKAISDQLAMAYIKQNRQKHGLQWIE
jgi:REP element-mobilizing transposase RayT/CheY-like chemotaxis protein